ncbi:MAG: hypothetical protein LLF83_07770 [Methanobacterium sp.]|nr:hypothetical protein [Methanobacterium sp.]
MNSKPVIILLAFLMVIGTLGYVYARVTQPEDTIDTMNPPIDTANPPVVTTNRTVVVSNSSQDLIIVNNSTGNNSTVPVRPVRITQITPSGSIPHVVELSDGTNSVRVYAYCVEPTQKAVSGANLDVGGVENSAVIIKTAQDSNPSDPQSATNAQMKIWVLLSGGSTSQGEGAAYAAGMSSSELQSNLNQAKSEIMTQYHVSEDQIGDLVDYKPVNVMGTTMVSNFAVTVQSSVGVNTRKVKVNLTNNTTANNTTNQTNQTNTTDTGTNNSQTNNTVGRVLGLIISLLKL